MPSRPGSRPPLRPPPACDNPIAHVEGLPGGFGPTRRERATRASAREVFGTNLLEELAELLDLVLLLVRNHDPGLGEHLVGTPDRRADPQREGDRVAGPGRDAYA